MNQIQRVKGPRRGSVVWLMGALVVMVAALLVGCGGGSGGDSSSEESTAANSGQAGDPAGFELSDETRTCLKEQGVELPDPGDGPPGGAPPEGGMPEGGPPAGGTPPQGFGQGGEEMKEALEECGAELPQGMPGGKAGGPPMDSGAFRESIKEYATCMGENGYELPEPNLSGEGPVFKDSDVNREDPKFAAANEKCQPLLGGPGGGPSEAG
jgi:hypothetical protein